MDPVQQEQARVWISGMDYGVQVSVLMFLLFQIKHLVVDFFLQNRYPYMWQNKHKFFHPGGWLHAGSHAVASLPILALFPPVRVEECLLAALVLCAAEMVAHFFIDLTKMRIGIMTGWKCNTHPAFWNLLGVDQFLHQVTYVIMIAMWAF